MEMRLSRQTLSTATPLEGKAGDDLPEWDLPEDGGGGGAAANNGEISHWTSRQARALKKKTTNVSAGEPKIATEDKKDPHVTFATFA